MQNRLRVWLFLQCTMAATMLIQTVVGGEVAASAEEPKVGDTPVSVILERLGAKLEAGLTPRQRVDYSRVFRLVDRDGDLRHSKQEYIENGNYLTPQSRRGIFNAADSDEDGFVTQAEYILNRVITDEAKAIVQAMDDDKDGTIRSAEFIKHATAKLGTADLTRDVFAALDTNNNGEIVVPEYLQVWGRWARAGRMSPDKRIAKVSQQVESESGPRDEGRRNGPPPGFGPPPNPIFEALDADHNREISADEIQNSVAALKKLDANKDGKLTQDELNSFGRRSGGGPGRAGERERIGGFGRQSGGFGGPPGRGTGPPNVEEVFQRMDANKDGKLQKEEVPEFASQFIFPADKNNDQIVTKEELKKFRENRPGLPQGRGGR